MKMLKYNNSFFLILQIALVLFFITCCNNAKEKERIIEYYKKMVEFNKSEQYKINFNNYTELRKDYSKIANVCGFNNDDIITRIIGLHYDNDSDVLKIRNEWYSIKNTIDSIIIKNINK